MRNRKRIKRTTKQYITVAVICIVVIGGAALVSSILFAKQMKQEYESKLGEMEQVLSDAKRRVYVSTRDIKRGEIVNKDNVEERSVYSSSPQENYITAKELGKAALIEIIEGTQITHGMLTENVVDGRLREVEFDVIQLNSNLKNYDVVDVRILFPNGEDFSVLSKKSIQATPQEMVECYFWLDEEEILRMQSAVVDAYFYPGTYLYTTKYIEPNIQNATIITYEPSIESLHLIQENPNIVETATNELSKLTRKALENRLATSMNKDITTRQWNIESDYIYHKNESAKEEISESQSKTRILNSNELETKESEKKEIPKTDPSDYPTMEPELGRYYEREQIEETYFITEGKG